MRATGIVVLALLFSVQLLPFAASLTPAWASENSRKKTSAKQGVVKPVAKAAETWTEKGLVLDQQSTFYGQYQILICSRCVQIVNLKNQIVFATKAPFTSVTGYNPASKSIYTCSYQDFRSPSSAAVSVINSQSLAKIPVRLVKPEKLLSLDCQRYESDSNFAAAQMKRFAAKDVPSRTARKLTVVTAKDSVLCPAAGDFILRFYELPLVHKVPLKADFIDITGDAKSYLTTFSCKNAELSASQFAVPAGYKKVDDMRLLLVDEASSVFDLMMRTK